MVLQFPGFVGRYPIMTAGKAGFPRTQNGYSAKHVDEFIAALVQRARAQVTLLESRIAELQAGQPAPVESDTEDRLEAMVRLVAERDAQLAEERARILVLQSQLGQTQPEREPDAVTELEERTIVEEPQDWAASVIGRSLYDTWSDEQRDRAAIALRRKRLSACTPTE